MTRTKTRDIESIKERLAIAAKGAENPSSLVGQACWGYFAADVLKLIEDHSKIESALLKCSKDSVTTHPVD